jgi:hypothetical protein
VVRYLDYGHRGLTAHVVNVQQEIDLPRIVQDDHDSCTVAHLLEEHVSASHFCRTQA